MAFRISTLCENWFSNISGQDPLKRIFDYYYLCLLLGLTAPRSEPVTADSREFIDDFIAPYKPFQRQIVGMLVLTHLHQLGIEVDEKRAVADQLAKLVTPDRSSQLTEDGFRLLNEFAYGGFFQLSETLEKPHNMVFFLQKYNDLLEQNLRGNALWASNLTT